MADDATPSVERLLTESVWLTGLARALLHHDEHAAEDVAQEVRLAALREAPDDPGHARAWLVRVARNLALRTQLRRTRRERRERAAAVGEALPSTLDLVARVNAQQRVADAVVALAEPYRSVVLLRYFDALTARDIAERQRVPIETVRTRLKRALAQLRERLDQDFGKRDAWAGLLLPWALPAKGAAAAAGAGAGTAAVATGVAAMSLTAKVGVAAAVVVAGILVWSGTTSSSPSSRRSSRDGAADSTNALENPVAVATKEAGDGGEPHAAAAQRTADAIFPKSEPSIARDAFHVLATIVAASDSRPVAGALVTVFFYRREGDRYSDIEEVSARSDASGKVEALLPATAQPGGRIEVVAPEFAPRGRYGVDLTRAVDRRLDMGMVTLERGAIVKGRVVRSRDGRPVANADLRLALPEFGVSVLAVDAARPEGVSGPDGTFVLPERVGPTPQGTQATLYAITDGGVAWTQFNLVGGVEEAGGIEIAFEEPAALTVTLRDENGKPVPLADVTCAPCFGPLAPTRRGEWNHNPLHTTNPRMQRLFVRKGDEQGSATFDALPTATFASDRFHDPSLLNKYEVVANADGYDLGFTDFVPLTPGGASQCEVVLRHTHTVTLVGRVVGLDGRPIPDAHVEAWASPSTFVATTDEDGEYRIDGAPSTTGSTYITVKADQHALHQELYRFSDLARAALHDAAGAPLEAYTIDVSLERAVHIVGRVVDESGVPIAGAMTYFSRIGRQLHGMPDGTTYHTDPPETDAQGRFDFEATETEWFVSAVAPLRDGGFGPAASRHVTGGATDLVLTCVTHVSKGASLSCEVVDARSGVALPVVSAFLRTADELRGLSTPPKCSLGSVTMTGLDVGRWRIELEVGDHRRAAQEFEVVNGLDEVRLRIAVGAMARVAGRVESDPSAGASGGSTRNKRPIPVLWRPLEAHAVDASGQVAGDPKNAATRADSEGRFYIDGFVPDKTAIVYATDFESVYDEVVFTPKSGETREVVLTMRPASHYVIQRVDDFSSGNLVVDLSSGDEPWHRADWMDRTPRDAKDFPHPIKPGHHRWRALYLPPAGDGAAARVRSAEGEFDVAAGETHVLRIAGLR